ncbi:tyrosine-type recombinase/integrase [Zavarzinia sp. CC-PAN008]|uniref:tyrosine-type recombinase/integrase n=1 Tax=Zavarzinia sp. CC-PAN008 TaxID=3243332 RepID=UPI003F742FC0
MARVKIPYLVVKPGAAGDRYYWQPARVLRDKGWKAVSLGEDQAAALAHAQALNRKVEAWRTGQEKVDEVMAPDEVVAAGTLGAVIRDYQKSSWYRDLAPRSKRSYDQNIDILRDWAGDIAVRSITSGRVQKLHEAWSKTPTRAKALVGMLRILLDFARRRDLVEVNAAEKPGIKQIRIKGRLWSDQEVIVMAAAAGALGWHSIGTAIIVNHWIGQREGDVLALPRTALVDGVFSVEQSKTGARIEVEDNPFVRRRVERELKRQKKRKVAGLTLLLCETTSQPWGEDYFRHCFADVRARAAKRLPSCKTLRFMHLRHTAVTRLSEAGCTPQQIAGVTGHSLARVEDIIDRYLVRTAALSREATDRRARHEAEKKAAKPGRRRADPV